MCASKIKGAFKSEPYDDDWRSKFGTACEAFHVPLPSIKDYPLDVKRINSERSKPYSGGVRIRNVKIEVPVEILVPVIRYKAID